MRHASAAEVEINAELAQGEKFGTIFVEGSVRLIPAEGSQDLTNDYLSGLRDERIRIDNMLARLEAQLGLFERQDLAWMWLFDQRPDKLKSIDPDKFQGLINKFDTARTQQREKELCGSDSFARVLVDFMHGVDPVKYHFLVELFRACLESLGETRFTERVENLSKSKQGQGAPVEQEPSGTSYES
ncbi:hypothetical protein AB0I53_19585 [Saccharopolyspora sp. NPDC050389]|uniref:hypothetical protein n=1 Tax=Saccharopolyspora sp. NPDC050389 TaxID=3155516 RepID=UPI0034092122